MHDAALWPPGQPVVLVHRGHPLGAGAGGGRGAAQHQSRPAAAPVRGERCLSRVLYCTVLMMMMLVMMSLTMSVMYVAHCARAADQGRQCGVRAVLRAGSVPRLLVSGSCRGMDVCMCLCVYVCVCRYVDM